MSPLRLPAVVYALFVVIASAAVLSACGEGLAQSPNENPSTSIPPPNVAAGSGQLLAPSFSVSTGEGTTFSLGEHGGEVVVLYFSFPG